MRNAARSSGRSASRVLVGAAICGAWLAASCGRPAARVEEAAGAGWQAAPLELAGLEGGRDGYRTHATVRFSGPGGGHLEMELVIVVDPQASLESGSWSYDGPVGPASGVVVPEHILFAGGQGDGVSIGGSYLLQSDGVNRFRVSLRPHPLGRGAWKAPAN